MHRDDDLPAFVAEVEYDNTDKYFHWANGTFRIWCKNGLIHRDNDLPAIVDGYGRQIWCKNGLIHRDNDLAAIIDDVNYLYVWMEKGMINRNNGPAIISSLFKTSETRYTRSYNDTVMRVWMNNNKINRTNGPAYVDKYVEMWFRNNILHRPDGPAIIDARISMIYSDCAPKLHYYKSEKILEYERKLKFKYFHKWYEKIYSNIDSEFVQKQINNDYDKLFISS